MPPDRIFQGESTFPDHEEWFYRTREGVAGPYMNKDDAALALRRFIKYCQENKLDGGRAATDRKGFPKMLTRLATALSRLADALETGRWRTWLSRMDSKKSL